MGKPEKRRSISTKKGDQGTTSLFDGTAVSKASLRPSTYGTLDEASAFIGLARARTAIEPLKETLLGIQSRIYLVNSELACPPDSKDRLTKRFSEEHLRWVEQRAREIEEGLDLPPRFVVYGETEVGALLDIARAVVRRAERHLTALLAGEASESTLLKPFVNRLSDFLYLLARWEEREQGCPPRHPEI